MLIHGSPDILHPVTLGGLSAAVSDADIANYISEVLNTVGLTDAQKAAQIADAAEQYGVTIQDISRSTGYSIAEVSDYLYQSMPQSQTPPPETPKPILTSVIEGDYYAPIISPVTVEPDKNTSSGVSFTEVKRVLDMYLTNPQIDDQHRAYVVAGYMRDKNISVDEIAEIMGYSPVDVTNYLAIAYQPPTFDESVAKVTGTTIQTQPTAAQLKAEVDKNNAAFKAAQAAAAAAMAKAKATAAAEAAAKFKASAAAEAAAKAKEDATGKTVQTQTTSSQTGISSAMPLILAAAAAYFLGA